jgi:peptidoglycan/xylan/chitin deacetylase (PgdA/CDA1 family)
MPRISNRRLAVRLALICAIWLGSQPATAQVIRAGPSMCRGIALTFDMCPVREGSGYDEGLVQMLIERHIPATFFLSGRWMTRHDEQVRALQAIPYFELGTHGQTHAHLPLLTADEQRMEIHRAVALLQKQFGHQSALFRPPFGEFDDTTIELVRSLGLRFILWNIESGDPDPHLSAEQMLRSIKSHLRNGAVIVFHANGKGQHTREVIDALYQEVLEKGGPRPMTVSQLLGSCGDTIEEPSRR